MKRALCIATLLFMMVAAYAEEKKAALPPGEHPDSVLVVQKNKQGAMAPVILGKMHTAKVEQDGQQVEKPDPLCPGCIVIVRDLDEVTAKGLRVVDGSEVQVGGAYIARENHELEYLGQVDLSKNNVKLAKDFGIGGQTKAKGKPKANK
jgi:hypothetical protein